MQGGILGEDVDSVVADPDAPAWLFLLGEAAGLHWVVRERQLGFTAAVARVASKVAPGDLVFLVEGRGAHHNPTRDVTRLFGLVRVSSDPAPIAPVDIAGKTVVLGCAIDLLVLLRERAGVPIAPIARQLSFVRQAGAWGVYFRRGFQRLTTDDVRLLSTALLTATTARE